MHASSPTHAVKAAARKQWSRFRSGSGGFSLVEVTLAIGVIAFAFVALLGLLPAVLTSFRAAIDLNNETRIVQSIVGKVQVTDFNEVPNLDYSVSNEIFYFDEEGTPTDTSLNPVESLKANRLYAAKLFVRPAAEKDAEDPTQLLTFSVDVIVVFANLASAGAAQLERIENRETLSTLLESRERLEVRVRPVLVSKMDGYQIPNSDI
jgi:uncharacterized protein (TIGR02598 family)